jgi:hypothetical protein
MEKLRDKHIHPYIEKKLLIRLYIFLIISILLVIYIVHEIYRGNIFWLLAVTGICFGGVAGIVLGRFMGVTWHEEKEKVISKLDVVGAIAIVLFITLDLSREWIFGHWIQGVSLSVFTLCVLAGALFGRFLGMRYKVLHILKEQDIVEGDPKDIL